jgi:hypothetical protein
LIRDDASEQRLTVAPFSAEMSILIIPIFLEDLLCSTKVSVHLNMSQGRISAETWEHLKISYAAGAGLRELARKMDIPQGTILAHAKRKGWTQQIQAAKQEAKPMQSDAITPLQSIAAVMQERGQRYRERVAGVSERVIGHVEAMDADEILLRSAQVEKIDTIARRTFGLDNAEKGTGALNLAVLSGGRAIVQVAQGQSKGP